MFVFILPFMLLIILLCSLWFHDVVTSARKRTLGKQRPLP